MAHILTVEKIAAKYGVAKCAVRRLCAEGKLPHVKVGVKILISDDVFEEFFRGTASTSEPAAKQAMDSDDKGVRK